MLHISLKYLAWLFCFIRRSILNSILWSALKFPPNKLASQIDINVIKNVPRVARITKVDTPELPQSAKKPKKEQNNSLYSFTVHLPTFLLGIYKLSLVFWLQKGQLSLSDYRQILEKFWRKSLEFFNAAFEIQNLFDLFFYYLSNF